MTFLDNPCKVNNTFRIWWDFFSFNEILKIRYFKLNNLWNLKGQIESNEMKVKFFSTCAKMCTIMFRECTWAARCSKVKEGFAELTLSRWRTYMCSSDVLTYTAVHEKRELRFFVHFFPLYRVIKDHSLDRLRWVILDDCESLCLHFHTWLKDQMVGFHYGIFFVCIKG